MDNFCQGATGHKIMIQFYILPRCIRPLKNMEWYLRIETTTINVYLSVPEMGKHCEEMTFFSFLRCSKTPNEKTHEWIHIFVLFVICSEFQTTYKKRIHWNYHLLKTALNNSWMHYHTLSFFHQLPQIYRTSLQSMVSSHRSSSSNPQD